MIFAAVLLPLLLAGLVAGGRATCIDIVARRWVWAVLDILGMLATFIVLALFLSVYNFVAYHL